MIPRKHRIDGATLKRILPQSKTHRTQWGSLRYFPGDSVRITCIISKKTAKLSPDRHRIKRKVYTAISGQISKLLPGYYMLFPHSDTLHISSTKLLEFINSSLATFYNQSAHDSQ